MPFFSSFYLPILLFFFSYLTTQTTSITYTYGCQIQPIPCSGNGICTSYSSCLCNTYYYGDQCDQSLTSANRTSFVAQGISTSTLIGIILGWLFGIFGLILLFFLCFYCSDIMRRWKQWKEQRAMRNLQNREKNRVIELKPVSVPSQRRDSEYDPINLGLPSVRRVNERHENDIESGHNEEAFPIIEPHIANAVHLGELSSVVVETGNQVGFESKNKNHGAIDLNLMPNGRMKLPPIEEAKSDLGSVYWDSKREEIRAVEQVGKDKQYWVGPREQGELVDKELTKFAKELKDEGIIVRVSAASVVMEEESSQLSGNDHDSNISKPGNKSGKLKKNRLGRLHLPHLVQLDSKQLSPDKKIELAE